MKRKVFYAAVLVIFPCVVLILLQVVSVFYPQAGDAEVLTKAFDSSGASVVEVNINAYASAEGSFLEKEEVTKLVKVLADGMELDFEEAERLESYDTGYNQLSIIGKNAKGYSTVIIVHSMDFTGIEDGPGGFETNIVVDAALGGDVEELPHMERKISELVAKQMEGVRTTCCIVGSYAESVPEDSMEAIIGSILQSADALEVERAVHDGFKSVSAYTPRISHHVEIRGQKVNLNIAMRYNSFEGRTYIWLGSPVISLEY